ncbi:WD repeat-containing protein 82-like [Paramacrobiotus metropolitanus]|uniref:WD repeat-containing protein 82-like n=1 Tax=Paramacrobiotus metropolitanus TaxID=2943436 RepID=UPI00244608DA|nr:WD repeat-containing protein 82-like [Paramacrobiotus metropolitanus]
MSWRAPFPSTPQYPGASSSGTPYYNPRPPFPANASSSGYPPTAQSAPLAPTVPSTAPPPDAAKEYAIDEPTLRTFRVSRTFSENSRPVNHLDFSPSGEHLLTSADDDVIVQYDCGKGSVQRIINSKKYGADNIMYSHSPSAALHSCTKVDHSIRYLNLPENKYITAFTGHTNKVVQLALSPVDDKFISSSMDRTIRIWDHRVGCAGVLQNLSASPIVAFDPEGLVFAAGASVEHEQRVMLYDMRNYHEGPFNIFRYPEDRDCDWSIMKISPNGRYMLICTNGLNVYVMDSFTGVCLLILKGHTNRGLNLEASFTPDSKYVIIGSSDGKIHIWSLRTGRSVGILQHKQKEPVVRVQFAPSNMLIASAYSKLSLWLPFT